MQPYGCESNSRVCELEAKMKSKGKAITLLSILCLVLAFFLVMTFIAFPIGAKDKYNGVLGAIEFDYDVNGGVAVTYELAPDSEVVENVDEVVKTLSYRLSALGYKAFSIKAIKDANVENSEYDIRIETRRTNSVSSDLATVMKYGTVQFFGGTTQDPTDEILTKQSAVADAWYIGEGLTESGRVYQVGLKFTDYGYNTLKDLVKTASEGDNAESYYLKVMLGDEVILSPSPITLDGITDKTVYLSRESADAARRVALQLKSGGLEYKYEIKEGTEMETITAMYGVNARLYSLIVAGSVLLLAIALMFVAYKGYGFISMLAMFTYVVTELGMMIAVPGIVVSLFGIIGMVVGGLLTSACLAITANKIREEMKNGRTVKSAIRAGYKRSLLTVVSACVISGVVGLLTFVFGGGAIQSFGIALGIGAVVSVLCVLLISRMFAEIVMPLIKAPEKFFDVKKEDI